MPCLTSFYVKAHARHVPCGKCYECFRRKVSGWAFRIMQEHKNSDTSDFITLTYATEHLPFTKTGRQTISKRDLQLFMKRLRKCNPQTKIKYYAVGEYGGMFKRPHYHLILFNADVLTIQDAWDKGSVHYGYVQEESVGYALKYLAKTSKIGKATWDDRQPQFALMSKGLGKAYLTRNMITWHLADLTSRMYLNLKDGKKIAMPRYYKDHLYTQKQREQIAEKALTESLHKLFLEAEDLWNSGKDPVKQYRSKQEGIKASQRRLELLAKN